MNGSRAASAHDVRLFFLCLLGLLLAAGAPLSAVRAEPTSRAHGQPAREAKAYRSERLVLVTDVSDLLAKAVFHRLTISLNTLWRLFEIDKFSETHKEAFWPSPCSFVLFTNADDYRTFVERTLGPKSLALKAPSYYYIDEKRALIVMRWAKKAGSETPTQTLRHEMAHVFLTRYVERKPLPPWIQEGFAQWFEFREVGRSSRLRAKYKRIKERIFRSEPGWFEKLMKRKIISPSDIEAYDESFVVCQFLIKNYRLKKFRAFVLAVAGGAKVTDALRNQYHLTPTDLEMQAGLYAIEHY